MFDILSFALQTEISEGSRLIIIYWLEYLCDVKLNYWKLRDLYCYAVFMWFRLNLFWQRYLVEFYVYAICYEMTENLRA